MAFMLILSTTLNLLCRIIMKTANALGLHSMTNNKLYDSLYHE